MEYKYIRVSKSDNRITSHALENEPDHTTILYYWIKIEKDVEGNFVDPCPARCPGDTVRFVLDPILTSEEQTTKNLIKELTDGSFTHSKTEAEADAINKAIRIGEIDSEIFQIIENHCKALPRRSMLFYLHLGIKDPTDPEYTAVRDFADQTIAAKHQQKIDEGLIPAE